jgi:hypothetical protein
MLDIHNATAGRNSEHAGNRDGDNSNPVIQIRVRVGDTEKTLKGREAWAMHALIQSGARGITSLSDPAPRLAHYVFCCRRNGFDIETITETHGGPFAGSHARYVLRSPVVLMSTTRKLDRVAS